MKVRRLVPLAAGVLLAGTLAYAMQSDNRPASPVYQGQNTGVFQMFFSPTARQDTFRVNTANGRVWALRSAGERTTFDAIGVSPTPAAGQAGQFRIYYGSGRADTFLLGTGTGQTWSLTWDEAGQRPSFTSMAVR
jgi:hypothetical protein